MTSSQRIKLHDANLPFPCFDAIGDDILRHILSFLPSRFLVSTASMVAKSWKSNALTLVRMFEYRSWFASYMKHYFHRVYG